MIQLHEFYVPFSDLKAIIRGIDYVLSPETVQYIRTGNHVGAVVLQHSIMDGHEDERREACT